MAFQVKIGDLQLKSELITGVQFVSNTPNGKEKPGTVEDVEKLAKFTYAVKPGGGNAKSTDLGLGIKVWGRINFGGVGDSWEDATVKMAEWSLVPSDSKDAYKEIVVDVIDGGQVVRQYNLNHAFVLEYTEELDDETGMGRFYIHMRQKKDWNPKLTVPGGFAFS